jgi:Zn-dependent metalloprotease
VITALGNDVTDWSIGEDVMTHPFRCVIRELGASS